MKIVTSRETLLEPLQMVAGVVEKRQTLPILSNVRLSVADGRLTVTATDMEMELRTTVSVEADDQMDFTLPARKLSDIFRALPEGSTIQIDVTGERAEIRSQRSRFVLGILPARDYPAIEPTAATYRFEGSQEVLKELIQKTQFAMAQQDVRYYLNGMLLELSGGKIRTVATDGHRMALSEATWPSDSEEPMQVIVPRKGILELSRLLGNGKDDSVTIEVSSNHIRVHTGDVVFTSKLIDGRYPDYQRVIPTNNDKIVVLDREELRGALQRTAILSNEKYRGVSFRLMKGVLEMIAHNPEQEEAKEELEVGYQGEELAIGFNVGYLIEVLTNLAGANVIMELGGPDSSCLVRSVDDESTRYVVMPMRI